MKKIKLTKGFYTIVDDVWYPRLMRMGKWYYDHGYARKRLPTGLIYMHQVIKLGSSKKRPIDHINGNSLDNRSRNLRLVSHGTNIRNSGPRKINRLKLKGVSVCSSSSNYRARIWLSTGELHLGVFTTAKLAVQAYRKAVAKYFKQSLICK